MLTEVPTGRQIDIAMIPGSDQQLIGQMLDGDEDAFTALYRRRQGGVYRFALQMTGSVVVAEDVTQEVFMALLSKTARFDPSRGSLASFLYGVARNLVLRRIEKTAEIEDYAGPEDILDDLTRRETIEGVRRAVLSLPPVYRRCWWIACWWWCAGCARPAPRCSWSSN